MASTSAERIPVLQYSTGVRSTGSFANASPDSNDGFGMEFGALDVIDIPLDGFADIDQRQRFPGVDEITSARAG